MRPLDFGQDKDIREEPDGYVIVRKDDEFEMLYNSWTKDDKKEIEQNLFE